MCLRSREPFTYSWKVVQILTLPARMYNAYGTLIVARRLLLLYAHGSAAMLGRKHLKVRKAAPWVVKRVSCYSALRVIPSATVHPSARVHGPSHVFIRPVVRFTNDGASLSTDWKKHKLQCKRFSDSDASRYRGPDPKSAYYAAVSGFHFPSSCAGSHHITKWRNTVPEEDGLSRYRFHEYYRLTRPLWCMMPSAS